MRRIVFVWFPRWSTDRFCRNMARIEKSQQGNSSASGQESSKTAALRENPFALTHAVAGGMRIAALNVAAERAGMAQDMALADARALCPDIMLAGADEEADKKALTGIADWLSRYTPWVAPSHSSSGAHNCPAHGPHGVYMDITGCAHLFGGEKMLMRDMVARLEEFGLAARAGVAGAPGAAWAIAHYARIDPTVNGPFHIVPSGEEENAIAHLPVAALRLDAETCHGLDAMGLKKINQLIDLPRAPLTARFGTDVAHRLDQALGEDEEPISPNKALIPYRIRKVLAEPISRTEDIAEGIARLASDLEARFIQDRQGARRLALTLYRVDGQIMRLKVGTAEVTSDAGHITRLFSEKLDRLHSDFNAGFGIDVMALSATVTADKVPSQIMLRGVERAQEAIKQPARKAAKKKVAHPRFSSEVSALLDRLGNRLGPREVYQMDPNASHIPERAVVKRPVMAVASNGSGGGMEAWPERSESEMAHAPDRPLTMLERAEPIEVLAEVPDGPPKRFRWRKVNYQITKTLGPERLAPEWWRSADLTGSASRTRDYFQAEDKEGRRFWLFRNGLYERETNSPEWYVHGVFG